ncbi:MAG: CBS domain-containing protein [Oscillospiraceae bacterium]|nr:CBS domain-containing protein [Oscillospiraceae bacterium]
MNILFFLTPKTDCAYLEEDESLREAMERMEKTGFTALPILTKEGAYMGTLTEGDLLRAVKNLCLMDMRQAEKHNIMECSQSRECRAVSVSTQIDDLVSVAIDQNFVPVVDDKNAFIGIVTRKAILQYCLERYIVSEQAEQAAKMRA